MSLRALSLEPIDRDFLWGRIAAAAVGGMVGGALFGALLLTDVLVGEASLEGRGIGPLAREILGTDNILVLWGVHTLNSIVLGVLFGLLVSPASYRSSILWGLAYGVLVWFLASFVLLRTLTGTPLALDFAAAFGLAGHLLYGLGLGTVYPWFCKEEAREAAQAESPAWRAWGRDRMERLR